MRLGRSSALVSFLAVVACEAKKEPAYKITHVDTAIGTGRMETTLSCGEPIVGEEGVGELRIGASVDSIAATCPMMSDTTVMGAEGMPARRITIQFYPDGVEAEIVKDSVWRISVTSPHFRTADSLGVGTPLTRLLQLKKPRGMSGEGKFFVASPDHCGMSFRLANAGPGAQRGDLNQAGLARLPKSASVSEILVFGCHLASSMKN